MKIEKEWVAGNLIIMHIFIYLFILFMIICIYFYWGQSQKEILSFTTSCQIFHMSDLVNLDYVNHGIKVDFFFFPFFFYLFPILYQREIKKWKSDYSTTLQQEVARR